MEHFDIDTLINEYPPQVLTVREQTRIQNRSSDLVWDSLFPRQNVSSVKLAEMIVAEENVAADRREWQGNARKLPALQGKYKDFEMNPIGSEFQLGEYMMQRLGERFNGNVEQALTELKARLPERTTYHVNSVYNRLELDAFEAWLYGRITVRNPVTGRAIEADLQLDDGAYILEDWANGNAWELFLAALENAVHRFGIYPPGAVASLKVINKIREDGPNDSNNNRMTRGEMNRRIADEIGQQFVFRTEERFIKEATGGGTDSFVKRKLWRPGAFAFLPPGGTIGNTYQAPIYRADNFAPQVQDDSVDQNGVRVFYIKSNGGKTLKVETQLNAVPFPDERQVHVYLTGIQ